MPDQENHNQASDHSADSELEAVVVRSYEDRDQTAVTRLYTEGLLEGQIAPNDTGADIENIREGYFQDEAQHFWVAESERGVIGMIGVARDEDHSAEIRRLRVDPAAQHQMDVARLLVETAVSHCKHNGFLKVLLDTRFEHETAKGLFDRLGFQHTRTRNVQGKEMLEFYLDLYRQTRQED
ncbi:MAG: GNAT family N-acetyltransferase [Phycisphaeraceae bacterium]